MAEGTALDPEACMQAVTDDIRTSGWSVSAVLGDEIAPPWAYTIGLWLGHQGPELAMFGLPVEHMTIILNAVGERIASGALIEAGDQLDGICPCSLAVRPVRASWRSTSLFAVSDRYYGYVRPPCLQVVWPDRRGRYPGDPGFQRGTRAGSRCCGCRVTITRRPSGPGSTSCPDGQAPVRLRAASAGAPAGTAGPWSPPYRPGRALAAQTFFWYERNVTTDTATQATASTSSPPQRIADRAPVRVGRERRRPIWTTQLSGLRDAMACIQPGISWSA